MDLEIDTNTDDIFNKIRAGQLDGTIASQPPAQLLQQYVTNPTLKSLVLAQYAMEDIADKLTVPCASLDRLMFSI